MRSNPDRRATLAFSLWLPIVVVYFLVQLSAPFAAVAAPMRVAGYDSWVKCSQLRNVTVPAAAIGLPTGGALVTKATLAPAGLSNPLGEYCLVDGEIAPVDPQAQRIHFEAAMPSHWNGKTVHLGGGGFNGFVVSPLGLSPGTPMIAPPPPLARGYVTFGSDSGHEDLKAGGMDTSFALNDEQLRNYAGEQLKKTHDVANFLVKLRYGAAPAHSYFVGLSGGGREALTVVQQYPEDYDGVAALEPYAGFTAMLLKMQLISRAMRLNEGAGWISKAKADFLRKTELVACDRLDGLEDSIISNGDACKINFDKLRCRGGKDAGIECFSDAQLQTLRIMHSPIMLPYSLNGKTSLPAYAIGADFGTVLAESEAPPTFIGGMYSQAGPGASVMYFLAPDMFVRFLLLRDPKGDTLAFDPLKPGKLLARLQQVSKLLDRTSLDMDRFKGRGGKLIMVQPASDQSLPATATIEYYRNLAAKYGQSQLDSFLRFYLIPGYAHGGGLSFNANDGPAFDALEDWVERGIAAGTLTVVDANPQAHERSRPLCVYPSWPKYEGSGDPNLATSFGCAEK